MKKLLNILTAAVMIAGVSEAIYNEAKAEVLPQRRYEANVQSKRLASGTVLRLQMLDPVSTAASSRGDMFQGMLTEDRTDENTIILPKGSIFRGTVSKVVPPKRLSRGAVLYLNLDHVVTPTGRQIPVKAGLMSNGVVLTVDGGIKAGGNYGYALQQNWKKTTDIIGNCIDWGSETGEKFWNGYPRYITIPIGATGGVIGGFGYYIGDAVVDLFKKGGDVTLHQSSVIEFILLDAVDVPVN